LSLESGRTLLQYRLLEPLREGGMGVVWKAVGTTLDREVAIKIREQLAEFNRGAVPVGTLENLHARESTGFCCCTVLPLAKT
jgi:serine/threonine protein kinase